MPTSSPLAVDDADRPLRAEDDGQQLAEPLVVADDLLRASRPACGWVANGGRQHLAARHVADELAHVVVGGGADDLGRRPDLDEAAVLHDRDAVADLQGFVEVVRDEDDRLLEALLEAQHLVLHLAPDQRVERRERLVEDQHFGIDGERPREADALLHAAAQLVGVRGLDRREPDDGEQLARAFVALTLSTPCTSRPYATLSITVRCGKSPKCWKTIATFVRRSARSCFASAPSTSWPQSVIVPDVGSISLVTQRTSVDLPLPERPMTTKTSPRLTSNEMSRDATVQPVLAISSARGSSTSPLPTTRAAFGPKTFQTSRHGVLRADGGGLRRARRSFPRRRCRR